MLPAERIQRLPHQLFAALVEQVETKRREGIDVINLGQGNPDQPTPEHIIEALQAAAEDPTYQRYISFRGLMALKEAVAAWYWRRHGVTLDPTRQVAILIGSKIGLEEISLVLLNPGDRALAPDPGYPDYLSGIALAQGELLPWHLDPANQFLPDLDQWPTGVRLAFLNYPNNPTGRTAPAAFYDACIAKALKQGTVLAHDLAYGDITFDGIQAVSLLSRPGGIEAGVEFTTLSKSYNMAGWRIGFVAGNATIIEYIELLQDHLHCSQWGAIQAAARTALLGPDDVVEKVRNRYQTRRDAFIAAAAEQGWLIPKSQGSIFLWCPVPARYTSIQWAQQFLQDTAVLVAPGSGFGTHGEGYIRIALTESATRLGEAAIRMARLIRDRA
ncbi:MAG: LL-diaminopimelate aminotransferase [Sulfobacillus acidophilus]|uniref:LL-diaminopimelate aminotransferase n=1 Tax=Sulfobacillus acidophilus TaxID=53633 RepID=A0A2T2WLB6_9FIRM|nr:MAG: LL-diaminopimelate aminotransferase [Sulfobacillus acidophilus]